MRFVEATGSLIATTVAAALLAMAGPAAAQHDHDRERGPGRGEPRIERHERLDGPERRGPDFGPGRPLPRDRWWDGAYGHGHVYPVPGYRVPVLPPQSRVVIWGGVRYGFVDGVWYAPGPAGYVVVRPPYGVVVPALPAFVTVVTVGTVGYWYANGVYYRAVPTGEGYEVVAPPVGGEAAAAPQRSFVYPRKGQGAEQQASDEYECHRWAVSQTGFDPTANATGTVANNGNTVSTAPDAARRNDYLRAQAACLDGRGYTVR